MAGMVFEMGFVADVLMAAGAFGAAVYCYVLSGRLKRFTTLETGMGGAIAVLSAQVDDMTKALDRARATAGNSANGLEALTQRAEAAAAKLELLVAALHDLPDPQRTNPNPTEPVQAAPEPAEAEGDRKLRFVRRRGRGDALEAAE